MILHKIGYALGSCILRLKTLRAHLYHCLYRLYCFVLYCTVLYCRLLQLLAFTSAKLPMKPAVHGTTVFAALLRTVSEIAPCRPPYSYGHILFDIEYEMSLFPNSRYVTSDYHVEMLVRYRWHIPGLFCNMTKRYIRLSGPFIFLYTSIASWLFCIQSIVSCRIPVCNQENIQSIRFQQWLFKNCVRLCRT